MTADRGRPAEGDGVAAEGDSKAAGLLGRPRARRRSMSDEVFDYVRSRIFDGTLKPNQRVPQEAVASALGVSRVPVREALIALEQHGLVASEPHRGTYVVPIRAVDIDDHYRMYGMIQGLAGSRAVHSITQPVLDHLANLHEQMCANEDPNRLWDLNYDFHSLINHTGGSSRVRAVLRHLSHNFPRELYTLTPGASPEANEGHAKILAALRDRDGAAADAANREHVQLEGENIIAALRRAKILAD